MSRRRGHREGTICKRPDGRWVAALTVSKKGAPNRRKFYYGKTRAEVAEKLARATADRDDGVRPTDDRITLAQFLRLWLKDTQQPKMRVRAFNSYQQIVYDHLIPRLGGIGLSALAAEDVEAFRNEKLRQKIRVGTDEQGEAIMRTISPRTVAYCLAILRSALNKALERGYVRQNVATLVDPPRVDKGRSQALSSDQARVFLEAIKGNRLAPLFIVAAMMGLREGELLALTWADLDLETRTISVNGQLQRFEGKLNVVPPKTVRSRRTLKMPPFIAEALRVHRNTQRQDRLFAGPRWRDTGFVFTTGIGTPIEPRNLVRGFKAILKAASLPSIRFHDLRHSAATLLRTRGVDLRTIMEILGHSQISITADLYSHVSAELHDDAAAKMDKFLKDG